MKTLVDFLAFLTIGVVPANAVGALPASADNLLPLQINNVGRVLMTDGQRAYWGDLPAGGIAIGDAVTDGDALNLLFVDENGDLGQDDKFIVYRDAGGVEMYIGTTAIGYANFIVTNEDSSASIETDDNESRISAVLGTTLVRMAATDANVARMFFNASATSGSLANDAGVFSASFGGVECARFTATGLALPSNSVSAGAALVSTHKMRINIGGADYDVMLVAV